MELKKKILEKIKEHKTEIIIVSVTAISAVGAIIIFKNWDSIKKGVFVHSNSISNSNVKVKPILDEVITPVISSNIMDNLIGNKLTATELGSKALCSAQKINKRIVAAGLATKLPFEDYSLTEAGRLLGEHTCKRTRAGYSFSNIEWDEKILEIIFSAEELLEIAEKHERVREILSRYAA